MSLRYIVKVCMLDSVLQYFATCCIVLHCVVSVLHGQSVCVAVCSSAELHCVA